VYDKLGDEVDCQRHTGHDMTKVEVMMRSKEIFNKWMNKPLGEKVILLRQQMNP
jgi:hypothetical protein